jgi:hypothetical protein
LPIGRSEDFRYALPIILTMHDHIQQIPEGVPVVSKSKLYSFLLNLEEYATFTTYYAQTEKAVCEIINVL